MATRHKMKWLQAYAIIQRHIRDHTKLEMRISTVSSLVHMLHQSFTTEPVRAAQTFTRIAISIKRALFGSMNLGPLEVLIKAPTKAQSLSRNPRRFMTIHLIACHQEARLTYCD